MPAPFKSSDIETFASTLTRMPIAQAIVHMHNLDPTHSEQSWRNYHNKNRFAIDARVRTLQAMAAPAARAQVGRQTRSRSQAVSTDEDDPLPPPPRKRVRRLPPVVEQLPPRAPSPAAIPREEHASQESQQSLPTPPPEREPIRPPADAPAPEPAKRPMKARERMLANAARLREAMAAKAPVPVGRSSAPSPSTMASGGSRSPVAGPSRPDGGRDRADSEESSSDSDDEVEVLAPAPAQRRPPSEAPSEETIEEETPASDHEAVRQAMAYGQLADLDPLDTESQSSQSTLGPGSPPRHAHDLDDDDDDDASFADALATLPDLSALREPAADAPSPRPVKTASTLQHEPVPPASPGPAVDARTLRQLNLVADKYTVKLSAVIKHLNACCGDFAVLMAVLTPDARRSRLQRDLVARGVWTPADDAIVLRGSRAQREEVERRRGAGSMRVRLAYLTKLGHDA